ncbi:MAG: site-specific integrase, partial [Chloroflexota bacterium]|nr:site-specific integrase [Chloroflexota bacterium]
MLQEAVDDYIASLAMNENGQTGNNQNTIVAYRNDLNQLCVYLDQQNITNWPQVNREQVAAYLLAMREQQSYRPSTIARKLAAFKSFFRFLHSSGQITSDPIEGLDAPRIRKEFPSVLSSEQIRCLFEQIAVETPAGQRDVAMLHVLCATGMRVTELVSLDLKDFDITRGTVLCPGRNGRMKRERVLPLPPVVVEATQQYLT